MNVTHIKIQIIRFCKQILLVVKPVDFVNKKKNSFIRRMLLMLMQMKFSRSSKVS